MVVVPSAEGEIAGHIAAMRKALAESSEREIESIGRAEEAERREEETRQRAERRERWMMAIGVQSAATAPTLKLKGRRDARTRGTASMAAPTR